MSKDFLISVIVTTYNNPSALRLVIDGLLKQTDTKFEIVIADDGSTNETRQLINSFKSMKEFQQKKIKVTHVWQEDNGFRLARIRNLGVISALGQYVIFLDGDCIPPPNFVRNHRKLAKENTIVLGQRILASKEYSNRLLSGEDSVKWEWSHFIKLKKNKLINRILPIVELPLSRVRRFVPFSWQNIRGCNFSLFKTDYIDVNGSDESFIGWGSEDKDLALRLSNFGKKIVPGHYGIVVLHLWHKESAKENDTDHKKIVIKRVYEKVVYASVGIKDIK